jgi:precorrin-6B methylase 2
MSTLKLLRKKLKRYFQEIKRIPASQRNLSKRRHLLAIFPEWYRSHQPGLSPLIEHRPWITYEARVFLERLLKPGMTVLEYGCGGSSLFFMQRVAKLVSVEHDPAWHREVLRETEKYGHLHGEINLVELEKIDQANPYSDVNCQRYISFVDRFPDSCFDLILIDGEARVACFQHACAKLKVDGWLVLDNSEREEYAAIHRSLEKMNWKKLSFFGPVPYNSEFGETAFWQKSNSRLPLPG